MGAPNNTSQPTPSRTSRTPTSRGGSKPLGCLLPLIILLALGAGLYWYFKNNSGAPNPNDFLTSLNLPTFNKANTSPEQTQEPQGFSQSEPINVPPPPPKPNRRPTKPYSGKPSTGKYNKLSHSPKNRVPSGYPLVSAGKGIVRSSAQEQSVNSYYRPYATSPATTKPIAPAKLVSYRWFLPSTGLVKGSVQSLISYSEAGPQLAPKPNQIITFSTKIYSYSEAVAFAKRRLRALGFEILNMPINDYERGGASVLESQDKNGNQIYFSFKPRFEAGLTNWKVEVYKKN